MAVLCVWGVQGEGTAERDVKLIQEALKDATDASVRTHTPHHCQHMPHVPIGNAPTQRPHGQKTVHATTWLVAHLSVLVGVVWRRRAC